MSLPFISVVVPTRDRSRHLQHCLGALADLDYPRDRFEVIVVDDGGTDALPEPPPRARDIDLTIVRRMHGGPGAARNTGVERARGGLVAFTDDDCMPARDWLRAYAAAAAAHPGRILGGAIQNGVGWNVYSEASQLLVTLLYRHHNSDPEDVRFFTSNNLLVPTDTFRAEGGFEPREIRDTAEDRELLGRLRRRGHGLAFAEDAVVYHRHDLSLPSFLAKHFHYGRGAVYFHRLRQLHGGGATRPLPWSFFVELLRAPVRMHYPSRAVALAALLVLSQVAYAAGFLHERIAADGGGGLRRYGDEENESGG
jgi:GT2 family glycosyltransferase